jgi:hypothetical protein
MTAHYELIVIIPTCIAIIAFVLLSMLCATGSADSALGLDL